MLMCGGKASRSMTGFLEVVSSEGITVGKNTDVPATYDDFGGDGGSMSGGR